MAAWVAYINTGELSSDALKERIFQALPPQDKAQFPPPPFPFQRRLVVPSYIAPPPPPQQQQQQQVAQPAKAQQPGFYGASQPQNPTMRSMPPQVSVDSHSRCFSVPFLIRTLLLPGAQWGPTAQPMPQQQPPPMGGQQPRYADVVWRDMCVCVLRRG